MSLDRKHQGIEPSVARLRRAAAIAVVALLVVGGSPARSLAAGESGEVKAAELEQVQLERVTRLATTPVISVDSGPTYTCAIRLDKTPGCWGDIELDQATSLAGTFEAVSVGEFQACAIRTGGTLACWGDDEAEAPPSGMFKAISTGSSLEGADHRCAIRIDDTLTCWGTNDHGETESPEGTFLAVSAGDFHTCAIRSAGTLVCWGFHPDDSWTPPTGTYVAVSSGGFHACAIATDQTLACWGWDDAGETNPPSGSFAAVDSGPGYTCGIRVGGALECWGGIEDLERPGTFEAVSAGGNHLCGLHDDGTLSCWGPDATPRPTAALRRLPLATATDGVMLSWLAKPAVAELGTYDVRYRRGKWNESGALGLRRTWLSGTTSTSATFDGSPGNTYCFSVRAKDADAHASQWTFEWCTAVPLDDRSMDRHGRWRKVAGDAFYRSTALRTSAHGATLTRTRAVADQIAIVATTCPTCGAVNVYWNSKLQARVSLRSSERVDRAVIRLKPWWGDETGTITLKVASHGKQVIVDGVAVIRR